LFSESCSHQRRFQGSKYITNEFAAGAASPQNPLGELKVLLRLQLGVMGHFVAKGKAGEN